MNYTQIKIVFKAWSEKYISEDELVIFKLSGDYHYIKYFNNEGQAHRTDGPAVEWADGDKEWWENGQRHRAGGLPAIEYAHGYKAWWENGQLHRDAGLPAREWANGDKAWWVRGKEYTKEQIERKYNALQKSY